MAGKPPRYYWDACVFLSYVDGDEDRVADIEYFLRRAELSEIEIVTSTLSIVEVAFAKSERESRRLAEDVETTIDELWRPGSGVILAEFYPLVATDARALIRTGATRGWSLKGPDAIHLATAARLKVAAVHSYDDKWPAVE
jgi:predicted nucleic acid-binding protein